MGCGHVDVEILIIRPIIGQIVAGTPQNTSWLFPEKMEEDNSGLLLTYPKKRDFVSKSQKSNITQSVAFVVFVAFLGTTMLIFEKFKTLAFRKVYGLWVYLKPVKSYGALKSKMGTVTDLSLEISHNYL